MSEEIAAPAATCANCGAPLHGRFCAACGQEVKPLDPPVRHFIAEFAQEFFDVDSRVLRSFARLLFSPGFLTCEHLEGRRIAWLSPLKLYLLASVALFTMLAIAGSMSQIRLTTAEDVSEVAAALRKYGYANLGELQRTIEAARLTWTPRVMFALVPLFAAMVALVERRARRHYPSHLVFALHVHAAAFVVRAAAEGLSLAVPAPWGLTLTRLATAYAVVYAFLAFRRAYGASRLRAALGTVVVGAVYLVALIAATVVVIGLAMFGPRFAFTWGA